MVLWWSLVSVVLVKVMVRLRVSVREAIAAMIERYSKEMRSPPLDPAVAESFQPDHSHFSIRSKPPVLLILAKKFV